jgi:polysaccharide export outer membrane protein
MGSKSLTFGSRVLLAALAAMLLCDALSTSAAAQSVSNYAIGANDVLSIQVFDQADLGGKYAVEADGTFSFPLIGRIKAAGLTIREFEEALRKRLADGYFRNPQVAVAIEQYRSQRIFVMGEVRTTGQVPLTGGMTLIEALARAGGALPSASGDVAIVRGRNGAAGPIPPGEEEGAEIIRASIADFAAGSLEKNVELRDGDTIWIARAESIYVFGQVRSPNAYSIQKETTVLQALSLAGGVTENAATNRITIVRIVDGEEKKIRVKLTDIVKPGDTIVVPERYF